MKCFEQKHGNYQNYNNKKFEFLQYIYKKTGQGDLHLVYRDHYLRVLRPLQLSVNKLKPCDPKMGTLQGVRERLEYSQLSHIVRKPDFLPMRKQRRRSASQ